MQLRKLCTRQVSNPFPAVTSTPSGSAGITTTPFDSFQYRSFGTITNNNINKSENAANSNNMNTITSSKSEKEMTTSRKQRPNRFTSIYSEMQQTCRDEIEAYAKCVMMAQQQQHQKQEGENNNTNAGTTYQMCAAEFAPVKECFRTVRRRQLLQQQLF